MEIKTCEDYVVSRLQYCEETMEEQTSIINELESTIKRLTDQLAASLNRYIDLEDLLVKLSEYRDSDTCQNYITFRNVYEDWDKEDFTQLTTLVPKLLPPTKVMEEIISPKE